MKKSVFGLEENIASALAYSFLWVSGIAVYVLEKDNKTVRFHALQSTIFFLACSILSWVVGIIGFIPLLGGLVILAFKMGFFVAWLYLMYTAYKGQMFKLPIIGDAVWEQVNK